MSKLITLYRNEMSRTFRKAGTLVILGLIIVICIVTPIGTNLIARKTMLPDRTGINYQTVVAQLNMKIKGIDEQLSDLDISDESEITRTKLLEEKYGHEDMIETYDFLISAGYEDASSTDLIILASNDLLSYLRERRRSEMIPAEERTVLVEEYKSFLNDAIETIKKLPQTLDFAGYIDIRKKDVEFQEKFYALHIGNSAGANEDEPLHENDYYTIEMRIDNTKLYTQMYEEFLLIDPLGGIDGTHDFWETQGLAYLTQALKDDLKEGVYRDLFSGNNEPQPLTGARRKWVEDSIRIIEFQIKNDTYPAGIDATIATVSKFFTVSAAKFVLAVLLIMIAGATISQEIATGSIKSLIIAPVRRWKIFVSKWMVILTIFLLGLVTISVLSDLFTVAVCGSGSISDYTYVGSQGIRTIPFFIYNILSLIVDSVDILFVIVVALMLSSLLRNTALSVALSVGLYSTIGLYNAMISNTDVSQLPRNFVVDLVPFSNFNLVSDLFPYRIYSIPAMETAELVMQSQKIPRPGLLFSSIYLILVLSCFWLIAMDSFTRRDIK